MTRTVKVARNSVMGLAAVILLVFGVTAPAHADVINIDYTLNPTDPTSLGPAAGCLPATNEYQYKELPMQVSTPGTYSFVPSLGALAGVFSQPLDPTDGTANCLAAAVSGNFFYSFLVPGTTYWLFLSNDNAGLPGTFRVSVEGPGTITIGSSTSLSGPSASPVGDPITLTANVTGLNPTGTVEFFDGTTSLGTATLNAGVATLSLDTLAPGDHTLTAVYSGDNVNDPSTSAPLVITIQESTSPAVTLPSTGMDSAPLALGAGFLLALGLGLIIRRRTVRR